MTLGALTIKARLGLTDEELVEQIKENPYLQFFIGLEAFQYSAPFDPSMMVYFRKRLPESVINDCNKRIVRHNLNLIRSSAESVRMTTEITMVRLTPSKRPPLAPRISQIRASCSLTRLVFTLISASPLISHCSMRPGRWPRVTSTLGSKAFREPSILPETSRNRVFLVVVSATRPSTAVRQPWEVAETLIDEMHAQLEDVFGHQPRTHRKKARQQFHAVAKKKKPRISKIRKAIKQQLGHLKRNLASVDALIACGGCLLAAGRHIYQKLLVVSELVRQQTILYHADRRSIPDRIVSLCQAHIRPIVRGKARCNVEFGAKISISVTGEGFTFLDRLSYDPYNEGEDLKAQATAYRRRHGHYPKVICADQIYRTRSNRAFCQRHGIRLSGPRLGRPKNDPELVAAEKQQFIDDQCQRNAVYGKIGQGKRRFGLGLIREKLPATQGSTIVLNILVIYLEKLLEPLFVLLAC
jgi:hypothetical protein